MKLPVYLDHHATTPCDPRVVEAMLPAFGEEFGNAASRQHVIGRRAAGRVEHARAAVAALIECDRREIVFTSGATEAINLALFGVAGHPHHRGRHVVTAVSEHKATLDVCGRLEEEGLEVTYLPIAADGRICAADVEAALRPGTLLVSLMYANNEIGAVHQIDEIGAVCKRCGVLFHCDAVQALGLLDCGVERLGVDLMSLSAHKVHGPPGVGALFVRRRRPRVRLQPMIEGGGHERGLRSGTLNLPGIVGFGRACELVAELRDDEGRRLSGLRDLLLALLRQRIPGLLVNGGLEHRLPNNLNIAFPGVDAEALLASLDTVAASAGAACTSAALGGSYVLAALPGRRALATSSLRLGLGRFTTEAEVRFAAREIAEAVASLGAAPAIAACAHVCSAPLGARGELEDGALPR